jgi:hypothetical protein
VAFELQKPSLRSFFEKLEKKARKTRKKAKLPARGIEPQISVWKAGLLTIRPRNFLLERRKKYESNLLKYCQKRLIVPSY